MSGMPFYLTNLLLYIWLRMASFTHARTNPPATCFRTASRARAAASLNSVLWRLHTTAHVPSSCRHQCCLDRSGIIWSATRRDRNSLRKHRMTKAAMVRDGAPSSGPKCVWNVDSMMRQGTIDATICRAHCCSRIVRSDRRRLPTWFSICCSSC